MIRASELGVEVLKTCAPRLERTNIREWIWLGFLGILILFGLYGLYMQIAHGHIVTGMRDHVVWGIFIANFIFFIGVSYAGAVVAGFLHLFRVSWRGPIMRIASLTTVIAAIIGPMFILLCMGRLDRLHYLFIHTRLQSPIIWDVLAITTFIAGGILFLYLLSIKDFAVYRDSTTLNLPNWKRKVYRWLALNYEDTPEQISKINRALDLLSLILIPLVVIVSSVLSWIFGMTLRPGWHSTIFGPYFVIASVLSGTAVLVVTMWIFRKIYHLGHAITDKHFTYLGFILVILASGYAYFTFSEYLTDWYGSEKWTSELIAKLFSWSEYGPMFLLTNLGVLLPVVVVAFKKLRTPEWITLASFILVISMWMRRYLIVVPTLETPLLPIQDTRPEYLSYHITWVEWALTLGGVGLFLFLFTLAAKFITMVPVSEMKGQKTPITEEL